VKELYSIRVFKDQSTWRLYGLGVVTCGVYFAYYIKKQTVKINELTGEDNAISQWLINSILAMSYISLVLFPVWIAVDEGHPVEAVRDLVSRIQWTLDVGWAFIARNRLNTAYEISENDKEWFHGLWTFLFSQLYFNYKINSICEESVEQVAPADS